MLSMIVKIGESILIGDHALIKVKERSGNQVYLSIAAHRSITIERVPCGIDIAPIVSGINGERRPMRLVEALSA